MPVRKIVVIGTESTGRSTLCEGLAAHFHTDWVPEYAREYLLAHGKQYEYEDLLKIAKGQLVLEDTHTDKLRRKQVSQGMTGSSRPGNLSTENSLTGPMLFIDTDLYVMKVWSEFVYGKCDPWILDQIALRKYDCYLLCRTDLPWAPDELREYPDLVTRETLFHIYKDCLINQGTPWVEIGGSEELRLQNAVDALSRLL